jgi:hypothetical protein
MKTYHAVFVVDDDCGKGTGGIELYYCWQGSFFIFFRKQVDVYIGIFYAQTVKKSFGFVAPAAGT